LAATAPEEAPQPIPPARHQLPVSTAIAATTRLCAARSRAYPGLTTSLIRRRRSSNGANALFIALIVSHSISPRPMPKAASSAANSDDIETPLINRLSVLTVTRKRSRRRRSIGCSAIDAAAPGGAVRVGQHAL